MGSNVHYPEEAPSHGVAVSGFWIDTLEVTNGHFNRFVEETAYLTVAERPLDLADFPGAPAENLVSRLARFHENGRAGRSAPPQPVVDVDTRRRLAPPRGAHLLAHLRRRSPGRPRRVRGCGGIRRLGRQGATDRSRVGAGRARTPRSRRLQLGRRARGTWRAPRQLLARRLPLAIRSRLRDDRRRRLLPAQWIRPLRHGRQRLGVDERLVHRAASRGPRQALLRATTPAAAAKRAASTRHSRSSASRAR